MSDWERIYEGEVSSFGGTATVDASRKGKYAHINIGFHASEFCSASGVFYPDAARRFAGEILAACRALEADDEV